MGFFVDGLYKVGDIPFYAWFVRCFYHGRVFSFVKGFFSGSIDQVFFVLY